MAIALLLVGGQQLSVEPQLETLETAFCNHITSLAALPVRTAAQTGPGLLRQDGLNTHALRHLALRWCERAAVRRRYGSEEVRGLAMALGHFSDPDFEAFVRGASTLGPRAFV